MNYFEKLSSFERITRRLIEGSFDKVLGGSRIANEIANEIVIAIDNHPSDNFIPNHVELYLDEDTYAKLLEELPSPEKQFQKFIQQFADETGSVLSGEAEVKISPEKDPNVKIRVICGLNGDDGEITKAFKPRGDQHAIDKIKTLDAFLIVSGKRHVPLEEPVVDIGRQLDNTLVIDDSTVSRKHAQIRWRFGRFVIHDAGSKSGTFVNGKRISESVLESGDVVTIGRISLIYGEDSTGINNSSLSGQDKMGTTREIHRDYLP